MTKKTTVITIAVVTVIGFGILIFLGANRVREMGESEARVELEVPFLDKTLDLTQDIGTEIWSSLSAHEIDLRYQVMILPWGVSDVSPLRVKAFHNKKDIYFYLTWGDNTEDRVYDIGKFSDASAMMFPTQKEVPASTLMMGFMGKSNIWQWKANADAEYWALDLPQKRVYSDFYYPFEDKELFPVSKSQTASAVTDFAAISVGTLTPKDQQIIQGKGIWKDNSWQVVMKRSLGISKGSEFDTVFIRESARLCAFAVWNGSNGDRGGRKSISDWVLLEVKK